MLLKHILILFSFVPFVMSNQCNDGDFWWDNKSCCLPHGGPSNPPSPPKNTKCPQDTHYWYSDKSCCAPRHPPSNDNDTPKCQTDWEWDKKENKCKPCATPPSPPKHKPSPKPGYHKHNGDYKNHRRSGTSPRVIRCPNRLEACPVIDLTGGYECLDTTAELESCGGCVTLGRGQDCSKIEGAWNVACEKGTCKVYTCEGGYRLDAENNTCVPL